jgi:hypothetical protein
MARKFTNQILEMIEDGILDKDTVILACLNYMSESEVQDMAECNEFLSLEDEDSEDTCHD